jgi:chemotaxis protein CheX
MLGSEVDTESPVINEEVLDVMAELTNMMVGNIKNGLESITGPLAISVPTVIHGRNFQFRNAAGLKGASLRFEGEGEQFEVRIALAPVAVKITAHPKIAVLGLAHV